jgi:hypothetical protein
VQGNVSPVSFSAPSAPHRCFQDARPLPLIFDSIAIPITGTFSSPLCFSWPDFGIKPIHFPLWLTRPDITCGTIALFCPNGRVHGEVNRHRSAQMFRSFVKFAVVASWSASQDCWDQDISVAVPSLFPTLSLIISFTLEWWIFHRIPETARFLGDINGCPLV